MSSYKASRAPCNWSFVQATGWPDGKQAGPGAHVGAPLPAQASLQTAGWVTGSPQPSPTRPSSLRETIALLIRALVGMSRAWAGSQDINPLKIESSRQPGVLGGGGGPGPSTEPAGKDAPGFLNSVPAPGLLASRPSVAGLAWALGGLEHKFL